LPVGLLKYLTSDRELAEVGIDVTGMGHSTRVAARSASAPATRLSRSFQRRYIVVWCTPERRASLSTVRAA